MNLHLNDTVVKRRMMQAMESLFRSPGEQQHASEEQLEAIYQQRLEEFTLPETRQISHVFVSRDRHGDQVRDRAESLYQSFSKDNVDFKTGKLSTDPFLSGLEFSQLSRRQLARHFGDTFAEKVFQCEGMGWCGPIESPYGWHLVWTHAQKDARPQTKDAVRKKLEYYFKREQGDKALEEKMAALREQYDIVGQPNVDPANSADGGDS